MFEQWKSFAMGKWTQEINVRDFIQQNFIKLTREQQLDVVGRTFHERV